MSSKRFWLAVVRLPGDWGNSSSCSLARLSHCAVACICHGSNSTLRSQKPWILEPSATGLCEPDLHVFAKLFEDRLESGLEAQALSGREVGGDDDVLDFFVGHSVDVDLTRQPAS